MSSLKGAIEDRSHVTVLGIAAGLLLVLWVNWRLARWLLSQSHKQSS